MDSITFRTDDSTRWGNGLGSDLPAATIDINFWVLYTAILAIQDHIDTSAGISSITVTGNQMTVNLTNHVALGPYTLPTASFNWRGAWQAGQTYNINDVFTATDNLGNSGVFLVTWTVTNSGSTFNQYANDGAGHNWYAEILSGPESELPDTGEPGAFLQLTDLDSPSSSIWTLMTRNLAGYIESEPNPLEIVWRYKSPDTITLPEGLTGSVVGAVTQTTTSQAYEILWNGANIGSINFAPSPTDGSFTFEHEITVEPGDILEIVAPSVPDPHLTGITFTLVAQINTLPSI